VSTPFERTLGVLDDTVSSATGLPVSELRDGTQVGRYVITGVLGRGGMGVVYAAHDPNLDRPVALKLLHETVNPEHLVREAQALGKLDDPHVVTVFDAGEIDGHIFIAMKLIDGEDLLTALATRKPDHAQIIEWFVAAGRGLAAAHAAGLVHRDFKPSNVLIDKRGRVAVTDFGLAHSAIADAEAPRMTGMGVAAGTPAYMSPEQHGLEPATQASDQFAFCVALWEALFGQHPYVVGPREAMSPFAIGHAIYDGPLIPPPRTTVSPKIVEALTRGLARAPDQRWPAMGPLLDVLAPRPRRRAWPYVLGGLAAAVVGGGLVWALSGSRSEAPTCASTASARAGGVWSAAAGTQIAERFGQTGRGYAQLAATQMSASLDRYAERWTQLAADSCTAEQTSAADEVVARRRACLDTRLDAMGSLVGLVTNETRADFVDHAQAMVDGLPTLADCTDNASLPGVTPPALAGQVKALETEMVAAVARGDGGDYEAARTQLASIAVRADALNWPPLVARAHLAHGIRELKMLLPARPELLAAAELATANHLDRDAARAWTAAMKAAAADRMAEAVAVLLPMARGAVARVGDPALKIELDVAYGRSLVRLSKWKEAGDLCRSALAAATAMLDGLVTADAARDCIVESLAPLGAFDELEPMLRALIDDRSRRYGPDHPILSDFLNVLAGIDRMHGKADLARAEAERVLAIRKRAYPPRHMKIAEILHTLGDLAEADGKRDEAQRLYEESLAIALDAKPTPIVMIDGLQTSLAYLAEQHHDHAGAIARFEQAAVLTRAVVGPDSIELAFVLLNYGQLKAIDNLDAGLAMLAEGNAILVRAHDHRAAEVGATLGVTLVEHHRYRDAVKPLEEAIAALDASSDPEHVAEIKFALAQAVFASDPRRAHTLASEAAAALATTAAKQPALIKSINAWLATHP
jgi:eukaryotic-like serine/threonine-protein kinase